MSNWKSAHFTNFGVTLQPHKVCDGLGYISYRPTTVEKLKAAIRAGEDITDRATAGERWIARKEVAIEDWQARRA